MLKIRKQMRLPVTRASAYQNKQFMMNTGKLFNHIPEIIFQFALDMHIIL